jgi:hypothetical protein
MLSLAELAKKRDRRQRIQRIMLTKRGPKLIREPEKVFLLYRVRHPDSGLRT